MRETFAYHDIGIETWIERQCVNDVVFTVGAMVAETRSINVVEGHARRAQR